MYIRSRSRLNLEPWVTHELASTKDETCPLITTFSFLFPKKINNKFEMISDISFCFSFKIMLSCHTLSYCFKNWDTFDDLRYILYTKKKKTLRSLPPTSNMSYGHVLRSHYVVLNCSNLISPDTNFNLAELTGIHQIQYWYPIYVLLHYQRCTLLLVASRKIHGKMSVQIFYEDFLGLNPFVEISLNSSKRNRIQCTETARKTPLTR